MAERKKQKTKRRVKNKNGNDDPSKEEYSVAKFVRFNCPTKSTLIMGNEMNYFIASKAIDCLLTSKWASEKAKSRLFTNRQSCIDYMQILLEKGLIFRAKKLVPKRKDRPGEDKSSPKDPTGTGSTATTVAKDSIGPKGTPKDSSTKVKGSVVEKSPKKEKRRKSVDEAKEQEEKANTADEEKKEKEEKKKPKKVKFEFHQAQVFVDGNDIYVWKYDPTSTKTFVLGLGIVFGAIGVCLFPLWPPQVRLGVYYLSLVAMGFVGVIISLVVVRSVVFASVWVCTWGKHSFWLLPNLTEDCGFFESFKPLYSHTISNDDEEEKKKKKSKKTDKEEEEGAEEEEERKEKTSDEEENAKDESDDDEATKNAPTDTDRNSDEENEEEQVEGKVVEEKSSDEEAGASMRRRKKHSNNGFEMVDVEKEK